MSSPTPPLPPPVTTPTTNPDRPSSSTLYPKIRKLSDFLYALRTINPSPLNLTEPPTAPTPTPITVPLLGTTKLHGTHADIVFTHPYSPSSSSSVKDDEETILFQSRNLLNLKPGKSDNCGFAAFAFPLKPRLLELKNRILERYQSLRPSEVIVGGSGANDKKEGSPLVIAGEWCGPGVQKGVAISKLLNRCFVIVGIKVLGEWMPDEAFTDIEDEGAGIFNISKAGFFRLDLDLQDVEKSTEEFTRLVREVEKSCPFGKALGVEGKGEGIVWKSFERYKDPNFWFKIKADSFTVSNSEKLPKSATALENRERVENFAKAVVTEMRLEQGWEYMGEMRVERSMKGVGTFLKWVVEDVMAEEEREMEMVGVGKQELKPSIVKVAKEWYEKKVGEKGGGGNGGGT